MAKISVVMPHYPFSKEIDEKLKTTLIGLRGMTDETLIIVNDGIGFAKAVNQGLKIAHGDYIMVVNNDLEIYGDISQLCIPGTVTSPAVNGLEQPFWGCFFVIPRDVYEKVGGLDEEFEIGYFEDDAYIVSLKRAGIPMKCVPSVYVKTEGGSTMNKLPNRDEIFLRNQALFEKKYGNG